MIIIKIQSEYLFINVVSCLPRKLELNDPSLHHRLLNAIWGSICIAVST
jgi:hypothetical protein